MINWNDVLIAEMTGLIIAGGVMLTCCLVIWLCLDHLKRLGGRLLDKLHGWADERATILPINQTDAQMAEELRGAQWQTVHGLWYAPDDGSCDEPMSLHVAYQRWKMYEQCAPSHASKQRANGTRKF